ncbi:MAG: molybdopterin molybdotransferase MoeA [Thermodesulfovibrionales bacterium]|nr:molybdopterin molybdotransferase MoeA [Thermodesulfovibrionales bacterium]
MLNKEFLLPAEALKLIMNNIKKADLALEVLKIENCYGRIIADDVLSPEDLPNFPRSTVDGYAIISSDTYGASETSPTYIDVKYEIPMGVAPDFKLNKLEGAKISTGAMLPTGADAVIMLENTQIISSDMIEITKSVASGENVIQKGEDLKMNEILIRKGSKLRAQDIGALAAVGITEIKVYKKPPVSIISTGDEIIPHHLPVSLGKIRDINSFTLAGLVKENGGIALKRGIVIDDYKMIRDIIEKSLSDSKMILISGGTSAGTKDMVAKIIDDIGGPGVLFHGLSIRPGKPMIGGIVDNVPIFGLPGHPVAVVICFDLIVRPILNLLTGLTNDKFPYRTIKAKIAKNIPSAAGREDHIRVFIEEKDSEFIAHPLLGKSGLVSLLVKGEGTVTIPPNKTGVNAGDEVEVKIF